MKKFVSLLMCCAFAISAFAVFPQADEAITKDEAVHLIEYLDVINDFKGNGTFPFASEEFVPNESAEEILERAGYGEKSCICYTLLKN